MILSRLAVCFVLAALAPVSASASGLTLPGNARQLSDRVSPLDSFALPLGPFAAGNVPTRLFEGRVERQSWRLDGATTTTLQILAPLRAQITAAGYDIVFDCHDLACGGFDFRFGIEVIAAPDMHVDIHDFRFLAAIRGDDEALGLLISRVGSSAYVQVVQSAPPEQERLLIAPRNGPDPQIAPGKSGWQSGGQPGKVAEELLTQGHVILGDLVFATGAAQLGDGPFTSLQQLAGFLKANPGHRMALVGHTDNVGSLTGNIALSRNRAAEVRARMIGIHGIAGERIKAEGMGYLAPVASNLTPQGREANRRVEAILLSK